MNTIQIKTVAALLLFLAWALPAAAQDFNIVDYGAIKNGPVTSTAAISKAIAACSKAGGGKVIIPAGKFISGTILLKDNITLVLESGAILSASTDPKDYPRQPQPVTRSQKDKGGWFALLYAAGNENITISGSGTIDGNGAAQVGRPDIGTGDLDGRPRNILFISCKNIRVEGITLLNSGIWCQHYLDCENVSVRNIRVFNHSNRNNDGIDIDGCRRFILSNSFIDSEDDGIVLKSTGPAPCENIVVDGCIVSSLTNAIKCGTESTGGFRNISISNCIITPSINKGKTLLGYPAGGYTGLSLEIVDGGIMDGVNVDNLVIEGTRCPVYVRLGNRARKYAEEAPASPIGKMRNIRISNITAYGTGNYSSSITGIPGAKIENIYLSNWSIVNQGGLKAGDYTGDIAAVKEEETGYPQPNVWGNLPGYGLFIRHVGEISIDHVSFRSAQPDPRLPVIAVDVDRLTVNGLQTDKDRKGPDVVLKSVKEYQLDKSVRKKID